MLLTHSVAAQQGHTGPARNDHRARLIARALVSPPVFIERPAAPSRAGLPDARPRLDELDVAAPRPASTSSSTPRSSTGSCTRGRPGARSACRTRRRRKIADRIHRVASSRFWRWPTIRLNQVNWYALMYAADATVTGRSGLLRRDLRAQLAALRRERRRSRPGRGQLRRRAALPLPAATSRPTAAPTSTRPSTRTSCSRSCASTTRRATPGMAPLSRAGRGLIRRWERRAIAGYWTHAGYLNWDTGLGFERWHQAKKLGLAQQALIGIAQVRRLQPAQRVGAVGQVDARPRPALLRAAAGGGGRAARSRAVQALHGPAERRQRAARRRAAAGQRRPRGRGGARAHARAPRRPRCTPSTPTSAASP